MIAFKDFRSEHLPPTPTGYSPFETFDQIILRVNAWIAQHQVRVLNIETVLLPSVTNHSTGEIVLYSAGEVGTPWQQIVRLWYEPPTPPPVT